MGRSENRKRKLPKWARIYLQIFCNEEDREELEGDILDNFAWRINKNEGLFAHLHLIRDVILSSRFLGSKTSQFSSFGLSMSFFKVSHRFILKNRLSTTISILSLLLGLTFSFSILTYTQSEKSWDNYIPESNKKYRLTFDIYGKNGRNVHAATSPAPYGEYFKNQLPEIENYIRFSVARNCLLANKGIASIKSDNIAFGDSGILNYFGIKLLAGNDKLDDLNSVVISESLAIKLYGGVQDALNKQITYNDIKNFEIKGVFRDFPEQSTVSLDFLGPIDFMQVLRPNYYRNGENWGGYAFHTYFELVDGANLNHITDSFLKQYYTRFEIDKNDLPDEHMNFGLINVEDIHLYSDMNRELTPPNNVQRVKLLEFLAFMIAIIGWINFMNIQIARAPERVGEMGIRKTLGASNLDLQTMFLIEYSVINVLALIGAIILMLWVVPNLLYSSIGTVGSLWNSFTPGNLLFFSVGTLISATYPAIYTALQNKAESVSRQMIRRFTHSFQNALVTLQFTVTIFLTVFALVIYLQVDHLTNQDPGFKSEKIMVINGPISQDEMTGNRVEVFKEQLTAIPGIEVVSSAGLAPGLNKGWQGNLPSFDGENSRFQTAYLSNITDNFFDVLDIELLSGVIPRSGSEWVHPRVIINREAVEAYGWDIHNAIGKRVGYTDTAVVSGVVENFNSVGFQESVSPMVFIIDHVYFSNTVHDYFLLKISGNQIDPIIESTGDIYARLFPDNPFNFSFSEQLFQEQYLAERIYKTLFMIFSGLAILLAITGLIGLTIYHANRKRKEIGIRKVLGSGEYRIVFLFLKRYFILIGIASVISVPIASTIISDWLNNFASRIDLSIWLFAATIFLLSLFVMTTICLIVYDVARVNPVEVLKENG